MNDERLHWAILYFFCFVMFIGIIILVMMDKL